VPSIASPIQATNPLPSLQQQQATGSTQDTDNGTDPFSSMLDAAAAPTATPPTNTAGTFNTGNADISAAVTAAASKAKTNAAAAATKRNEPVAGQATTAANASGNPATVNPAANSSSTDPAQTAKAALAKAKLTADAANAPAEQAASAEQQAQSITDSAQQPQTTKAAADTDDDSSDTASTDAVVSAQDAVTAAAVSAQPIAAAITVATQNNSPPASGRSSPDTTIGDATKARAKLLLASAANTGTAAQASDDAPAKAAPTAGKTAGMTDSTPTKQTAASKEAASTQSADSNDAAQAPSQTGDGTTAVLPTGLSATTNTPPAAHADITAATTADGTANAQGASTGAKADGIGLPSFGLSAANGATQASATTAAAQAAASTAGTVPIAGLAVAIASHAQAGSHQFDIRLDPPELGRIDVQLNVDSNGQITSHITADRPDTLQLLQSQQPQIQQALDQSGLQTADNGLQFSLRDQSFAGQNNNGGNAQQQTTAQLVVPDADLPTVQSTQAYTRLNLRSGLDIRV
jgi:flagellar hook-length control protein FliK